MQNLTTLHINADSDERLVCLVFTQMSLRSGLLNGETTEMEAILLIQNQISETCKRKQIKNLIKKRPKKVDNIVKCVPVVRNPQSIKRWRP